MSESNVIPLGRIVATNEPVQDIIDTLEELLERARAGEIRTLAYAHVDGGMVSTTGWVSGTVDAAMLVGAIARLQYNACKTWSEAGERPGTSA
jgi:hypothetical protein